MAPNDAPHDPATDADDPEVLRLDDALKLAGVAGTGGQAKQLIQQGDVRVNGEVETRRKRKLVEGDVVEVGGESFEIALSDDPSEDEEDDAREGADADDDPSVTAAFVDDADDATTTTTTRATTWTTIRTATRSSSRRPISSGGRIGWSNGCARTTARP